MHPNEELARRCYTAFGNRDIPTVMSLLSDDITFVIPGRSIQSGRFAGKEEVGRYFKIIGQHTQGTHTLQLLDILANDDLVLALHQGSGIHGDKVFDLRLLHQLKVSGGLVTEVTIVPFDQYAFDEFWS